MVQVSVLSDVLNSGQRDVGGSIEAVHCFSLEVIAGFR
jgi:hypothetical protein